MTTIIADTRIGLMAADTFTNYGQVRKIWRCKQGIFGCAGDDTVIARFEHWILRRGKKPEQIINPSDQAGYEAFNALQMTAGKIYIWGAAMRREECLLPYAAIGSGGDAALAALKAGANIHRALEIAAEMDADTKPPFTQIEV